MANCFLCNKSLGFLNTPMFGKGNTKDCYGMCTSCHMNLVTNDSDIANRLKSSSKDEVIELLNKITLSKLESKQQAEKESKQKREQKEHHKQEKKEAFQQKFEAWKGQKEIQKRGELELRETIKKVNPNISASLYPEIKELTVLLMNDEMIEKADSGQLEYLDSKRDKTGWGLIVATNYRLIFIYKPLIGFGIKMEDYAYDKITSLSLDTGFLKSKLRVTCAGNTALINLINGGKQLSEFVRQKTILKPQTQTTIQHPHNDILGQIEKLADLKGKGIITNEEFDVQKSKLLEKL